MTAPETSALVPASGELVSAETPDVLLAFRHAILRADDARQAAYQTGDVDALANGAADFALIGSEIATVAAAARHNLAELLDLYHAAAGGSPKRRPKHEVPGLGVVEVPGGMERRDWRSLELLHKVVYAAAVDRETGEWVGDDMSARDLLDAVVGVLAGVLPLTASTSWKVGQKDPVTGAYVSGLRGLGLTPGDWCEEVEKQRVADVPRRKRSVQIHGSVDR